MRLRLHHLIVVLGVAIGAVAATFIETDPRYLGWLFALGAGLAGGAFFAAIAGGDPLAGRPASGGRSAPTRPAWFDEPENAQPPQPPLPPSAPR